MKKLLIFLALLAVPYLVKAYCPSCQEGVSYQNSGYVQKRTTEYPSQQVVVSQQRRVEQNGNGNGATDCAAACNSGVITRKTAQECNNCQGWTQGTNADQIEQDYKDYPN